jgi:hypothetical protein
VDKKFFIVKQLSNKRKMQSLFIYIFFHFYIKSLRLFYYNHELDESQKHMTFHIDFYSEELHVEKRLK